MKTPLEQALTLNKKEFIDKLISLDQEEVIHTLEHNIHLKKQYENKVVDIYNENIANNDFYRKVEFGESTALISLLKPEQRGWILYFSCVRGANFKVAYNCAEIGFVDNEHMKNFFSNLVFDEVNRLARSDNFPHLENNVDYLGFIDKVYKPYINQENYTFMLYASFVHHVKNGFNINNQNFLSMVGMQADNDSDKYKKQYYTNCMVLIEKYKEKLHFDLWTPELLGLFHKDIQTPNPYNSMGISSQEYELQQFAKYGKILGRFLMKNDFDEKFPEKQQNHKIAKI